MEEPRIIDADEVIIDVDVQSVLRLIETYTKDIFGVAEFKVERVKRSWFFREWRIVISYLPGKTRRQKHFRIDSRTGDIKSVC